MKRENITDDEINDLMKQLEESMLTHCIEDVIDEDADEEYVLNFTLRTDYKEEQEAHETVARYQSSRTDKHDAAGEYSSA